MQQRSTELKPEIATTTTPTIDYEKLTTHYNEEKDNKYRLLAEKYTPDKDSEALTVLATGAASRGYVRTLQYLLSSKKIDLNKEITIQQTAHRWICTTLFIEAIREKQKGITLMLLENPNLSPTILDVFGKSMGDWTSFHEGNALIYAINNGDLDVIKLLLKKGANPDTRVRIRELESGSYYGSAMDHALEPNKDKALRDSIIKIIDPYSKDLSTESGKAFIAFFKTASFSEVKLSTDIKQEANRATSPRH